MAYNSAYTGSQVDAAVGAVRQKETKWDNKQDELTGTEDQLVGFNSAGEAVAVAKPDPLPTGGETGQVLTKTASGTAWDDVPSDLPAGGTDGQILRHRRANPHQDRWWRGVGGCAGHGRDIVQQPYRGRHPAGGGLHRRHGGGQTGHLDAQRK